MATKQQIQSLMAQLGPILNPLSFDVLPGHDIWGAQIDENLLVLLDFDEVLKKIVLSCELGGLPDGDQTNLYQIMLIYSNQWNSTGGSRLALDEPGGNIILLRDVSTEDLDAQVLTEAITAFGSEAHSWREMLASRPASSAEPAQASDELIRV